MELTQALINASEKASNIARACRSEKQLFQLLVQEKSNEEKNQRFLQDFKTLADVLIQETVKHDLGTKFPELADYIFGEESNTFTNTLGESISVQVLNNQQETAKLLSQVLDGDTKAADLLATEVHRDVNVEEDFSQINFPQDFPINDLGIWIDPIDSTAEYIQGDECVPSETGIYGGGLRCVTVLIGVFLRSTGEPVLGVVNQPFHQQHENTWQGVHYWGINYNQTRYTPLSTLRPESPLSVVLLSGSESDQLKQHLNDKYTVMEAAGAGYKQLCIALGLADIYILSRGSTYRWDSCAPHALLTALGGGVISYQRLLTLSELGEEGVGDDLGVKYNQKGKSGWCNDEGIVAYSSHQHLQHLFSILKQKF